MFDGGDAEDCYYGETFIGIEVMQSFAFGFNITPISLTKSDAEKLKNLIEKALDNEK